MPTAESFKALGAGNGFPFCVPRLSGQDYDYNSDTLLNWDDLKDLEDFRAAKTDTSGLFYLDLTADQTTIWTTLGGTNSNNIGSLSTTQKAANIETSRANAMKLFWNINGGSGVQYDRFAFPLGSGTRTFTMDFAAGEYATPPWFPNNDTNLTNDSAVPYDRREPKNRVCHPNSITGGVGYNDDPNEFYTFDLYLQLEIHRMYYDGEFIGYGSGIPSYLGTSFFGWTTGGSSFGENSYGSLITPDGYGNIPDTHTWGFATISDMPFVTYVDGAGTYNTSLSNGNRTATYDNFGPAEWILTMNSLDFYTYT